MNQHREQRYLAAKDSTRHWNTGAARTLIIQEYLLNNGPVASIKELSQAVKLPMTTCYRIVHTLLAMGWLDHDEFSGTYDISPRVYGLMGRYQTLREYHVRGLPIIRELADTVGAYVKLSLWQAGRIVCVCAAHEDEFPDNTRLFTSGHSGTYLGTTAQCLLKDYTDEKLARLLWAWKFPVGAHAAITANFTTAREHGWSRCLLDKSISSIAMALRTMVNDHPLVVTIVTGKDRQDELDSFLPVLKKYSQRLDTAGCT